jgi:serine protease AprX
MARKTRQRSEERKSALWGTGNRGGEHRSSALWGRGGRGAATALVAAFALLAPIAAFADNGNGNGNGQTFDKGWAKQYGGVSGDGVNDSTFVQSSLWNQAKQNGNQKIHVIIQSINGVTDAESAFNNSDDNGDGDRLANRLNLIGAVAVEIKAKRLAKLAQNPNLIITPDAPVHATGALNTSTQLWPYKSGLATLWGTTYYPAPSAPTIAIVDSGLDANRADFWGRAYPQVTLDSRNRGAYGDDRGHGTFVAGIAAGGAKGYAGAAPNARILPVRVIDGKGTALTSDVIAAAQWILANKAAYNIRVANFSLHSGTATHFYFDPLDRAVEQLWFHGVTVVAAAGNYGRADGPSGVRYSPGNDPFVITVGAVDIGHWVSSVWDTVAPWSAYGYTEDGFAKPEIGAPGRYMVGPVPVAASLVSERPDHVVAAGYMELSGTSFAAPAVAGAAAQILARHPGYTPDQVKGALMLTAKPVKNAAPGAVGVGQLSAGKAAKLLYTPPNPNRAAEQFVKTDAYGNTTFDYSTWAATAHANHSWDAASWSDASWAAASWSDASWSDASWSDASWSDASWADASWADASWADASWADSSSEDAAEGDNSAPAAPLDTQATIDLQSDPDLALPVDSTTTTTTTLP